MSDRLVIRGLMLLGSLVLVTRIAAVTLPPELTEEVAPSTPISPQVESETSPKFTPMASATAMDSPSPSPSFLVTPSPSGSLSEVGPLPTATPAPVLPTLPPLLTPTPLPSLCPPALPLPSHVPGLVCDVNLLPKICCWKD